MHDDIETEARRIVAAADDQGVVLRLPGRLAVRIHAPSATVPGLERTYADIDLVAATRRSDAIERIIAQLGYAPDKAFNLLNGATRLWFHDTIRQRQIDIFVGEFEMCHRVPMTERLRLERLTLPLAELLPTTLQIVQLNDKDVRDISALLLDRPAGTSDAETINGQRIAQICAEDWGLWKTATLSLETVRARLDTYERALQSRDTIRERADTLRPMLEAAPKTLRWNTRAVVGTRRQ